jgi:hypothetical protein
LVIVIVTNRKTGINCQHQPQLSADNLQARKLEQSLITTMQRRAQVCFFQYLIPGTKHIFKPADASKAGTTTNACMYMPTQACGLKALPPSTQPDAMEPVGCAVGQLSPGQLLPAVSIHEQHKGLAIWTHTRRHHHPCILSGSTWLGDELGLTCTAQHHNKTWV